MRNISFNRERQRHPGANKPVYQTVVEHYLQEGGGQPTRLIADWGSATNHYRRGFRASGPLKLDLLEFSPKRINNHLQGIRKPGIVGWLETHLINKGLRTQQLLMQQNQEAFDAIVKTAIENPIINGKSQPE